MEAAVNGLEWHRSSYCTGANSTCVEVAMQGGTVLVRDSKQPKGPVLRFTTDEWRLFVMAVASGEFS